MALKAIITRIASELGYSVTTESELDFLTTKLNELGKALYQSKDIKGCLWEITVYLDSDDEGPLFSSLVSLPHYVGNLRGLRYSNVVGGKIPLNDIVPRYHYGRGWGANAFTLPYRIINDNSPIQREISNASTLTFSIANPVSKDINVAIIGKTSTANKKQELVTIVAGETSVECIGNYEEIYSITKDGPCDEDITITDADDNEMGVIPNDKLSPLYTVIEVNDANASIAANTTPTGVLASIDILYKKRYYPFVNLNDEFPCPDCDDILFYLFAAWHESQTPGMEARTGGAAQTANTLLDNVLIDKETGVSMDIQFTPNGLLEAQRPYFEQVTYGNRYLK